MWSYSQAYVSMRILWTNVYRSNSDIILIYRATQFFRQTGDYCTTNLEWVDNEKSNNYMHSNLSNPVGADIPS